MTERPHPSLTPFGAGLVAAGIGAASVVGVLLVTGVLVGGISRVTDSSFFTAHGPSGHPASVGVQMLLVAGGLVGSVIVGIWAARRSYARIRMDKGGSTV